MHCTFVMIFQLGPFHFDPLMKFYRLAFISTYLWSLSILAINVLIIPTQLVGIEKIIKINHKMVDKFIILADIVAENLNFSYENKINERLLSNNSCDNFYHPIPLFTSLFSLIVFSCFLFSGSIAYED